MKRLLLVTAIFISVLLLVPGVVLADNSQTTIGETDLAREAAQLWLDDISGKAASEIPQWQGAIVTSPQSYNNLDGELNAYLFTIENRGVVGYILVSSAMYEYTMFQAGTVNPPAIPELDTAKEAIEKLGFKSDETMLGRPVDLLYTGIDGFYAVYEFANEKVAVNLIYGGATLVSDLSMSMPPPEQYLSAKKSMQPPSILTTGYKTLNMSYWKGSGRGWCGPCSGVSIGAYYRDYCGYEDLYDPNADMYDELYDTMETVESGLFEGTTWPWNYGSGFVEMTENSEGEYDNFDWDDNWAPGPDDYWTIVSDIDNGWPSGLALLAEWHWRAIRGYYWVEQPWGDYYDIICTNSATNDSFEFLDWMELPGEPDVTWLVAIYDE